MLQVHSTRASLRARSTAFTLIELGVVIAIMTVLIALLLPALSRARKSAMASRMSADNRSDQAVVQTAVREPAESNASAGLTRPTAVRLAQIESLEATVDLTPRLSVGTEEPQSIYEAKLSSKLMATAPAGSAGGYGEAELSLPLPPQVISLADLSVKVNGEPSDNVRAGDGQLVWHGKLPANEAATIELTYSAVGKGLYVLQTPTGRILDKFTLSLTAHGSDVRMLELSMQPTSLSREQNKTVYVWDYKRLMFGRPISVDVLGIAPIDRLGELTWLGPLSVVLFGVLIGLVGRAHQGANFDRWALLLIVGTFTGTYPLMYFAQQFVPLKWAIVIPAAVTLQIIGWRAMTILGPRIAAGGVVLPAGAAMAMTLAAAVQPNLQGLLLTIGAIGFFIAAMTLLPRVKFTLPKIATREAVNAVAAV